MKVEAFNTLSFGKALPTSKKSDYARTAHEAKKALGIDDGISILKIQGPSMPEQDSFDTGVGKLNSKPAQNFIDFMCFYTDTNAVKEFPAGQTTKNWGYFYCPYLKTALTFGEENINLLNIVKNKLTYGNILSRRDIERFNANDGRTKINFENELGTNEFYPVLAPLRKAYINFKTGLAPRSLEREFERYKKTPRVQNDYTRLALYPYIADKEPDLFKGIEKSPSKQRRFDFYKEKYRNEIEFFQFRQFLAQKEHNEAKAAINKKGKDFFGDCLIGFSNQEVWAFPDAFEKDACIGLFSWGLPALNFENILEEGSPSNKLFKDKISFFLENYDGIRFDVGWCYAIGLTQKKDHPQKNFDFEHKLYDLIETTAKEVKGKNFDTKKLMYEMDGFTKMFDWEKTPPKPIKNVRNIVNILTTEYEHVNGKGWGSAEFYKSTGLREDELMLGTNNHDGTPLRLLAENIDEKTVQKRKDSARVLSRLFHISKDTLAENPKLFVKAKFAELFTVKNQFLFFTDVLGERVNMDDQTVDSNNYRYRISKNYEEQYHTALQNGMGFNLMESLKMAMEAKGLDTINPELYAKVNYYSEYLREKGPKTEREANLGEKFSFMV